MDTQSYKTVSLKAGDIKKEWVVIDATDLVVGRLAARVALVLRGKNKASFTPHMDCGDNVIVLNADKVRLTGKKMTDKCTFVTPVIQVDSVSLLQRSFLQRNLLRS